MVFEKVGNYYRFTISPSQVDDFIKCQRRDSYASPSVFAVFLQPFELYAFYIFRFNFFALQLFVEEVSENNIKSHFICFIKSIIDATRVIYANIFSTRNFSINYYYHYHYILVMDEKVLVLCEK